MSDSANRLDLPRTGGLWETPNGNEWAALEPGPTHEAPADDAWRAGRSEDDVPSSFFHLRWLGDAD